MTGALNFGGDIGEQTDSKQLCIVDSGFVLDSPSMKHLIYSVPALEREGWQITVIAERIEPNLNVKFCPLRLTSRIPLLRSIEFSRLVERSVRDFRAAHPTGIIFGTLGLPFGADITAVHFLHHVWLREAKRISGMNPRERVGLWYSRMQRWRIAKAFKSELTSLWLPVSEAIADELRKVVIHPDRVHVLPNSYDESRFNPNNRDRLRVRKRVELNFGPKDFVFVFLSQGHYRRKGFWVAVEALDRLRRRTERRSFSIRLLVVGGVPRTLARLKKALSQKIPTWPDWISFTGMINRPEEALAAADAFLFPSFFEAFCLAEIEAAAIGLPLLLTKHHGSEMILEPGRNGLIVDAEPSILSRQIGDFLVGYSELGTIDPLSLRPGNFRFSIGRALTKAGYGAALLEILEGAYRAKLSRSLSRSDG
jgi:glycosyltransferase involved in cell wall biosynthesis